MKFLIVAAAAVRYCYPLESKNSFFFLNCVSHRNTFRGNFQFVAITEFETKFHRCEWFIAIYIENIVGYLYIYEIITRNIMQMLCK